MFGVELVRTFEVDCDYCGRNYQEGGVNNNNNLFIKQLKKNGWRLLKAGNFCCKECEESFKNELKNQRGEK